jgi:hypothetical protein
MSAAWLSATDIIALVDAEIVKLGADAFGPNSGASVLYSGPAQLEVLNLIIGKPERNHNRAKKQAAANDALLIDNTPMGQFIENFNGVGVYAYFLAQYAHDPDAGYVEADKVMRHMSRKFIETLWGKVTTAVCGAAKDRVFYQDEIPTFAETIPDLIARLLKSQDIDAINGVAIEKIRNLYKPGNYDAAYRLICLGEIRETLNRARKSGRVEDYQDYLERKEFYLVERAYTWRSTSRADRKIYSLSCEDRQIWKENKLRQFVANQLAARAPAYAVGPHVPHVPTLPIVAPTVRTAGLH